MRLSELIGGNGEAAAIDVTGLTDDSRTVKPGFLFAAFPGINVDRRAFIPDAIDHGAVAILTTPDVSLDDPRIYVLEDQNPRHRFALMASRFFNAQPENVVAITGTNGKTSVADFVRQIWAGLGYAAGSVGTLGAIGPDSVNPLQHTTPDPVALHSALADLANLGVDYAAIEASSHGLDQFRLDGVNLVAAAFTNITRDHMNYHGSFEEYLAAKTRLFSEVLSEDGIAVINADDPASKAIETACQARGIEIISTGFAGKDMIINLAEPTSSGQVLDVTCFDEDFHIELPLVGAFQANNAVIAAALAVACGAQVEDAMSRLEWLEGVPGRLQQVGNREFGEGNAAPVFVDYAHTPDALRTILETLKPHAPGSLSLVFGCGGDRDQGKRSEMGSIADSLADQIIVTDDNPRTEDPAAIRHDILRGMHGGDGDRIQEIGDRRAAIQMAVSALASGDVLVVAGKGHETGQTIGDDVLPFDDAEELRIALAGGVADDA